MHNIDEETYARVLTIRDTHGDVAEIGFTKANGINRRADGFGIQTGRGPVVRIEGEDLFAFRELLNELDEDAFTRPKDPVKAEWTPGDVVTFLNDYGTRFTLRRRHDGRWDKSVSRTTSGLKQYVDNSWGDLNVSRLVDHGDGFTNVEVLFQATKA